MVSNSNTIFDYRLSIYSVPGCFYHILSELLSFLHYVIQFFLLLLGQDIEINCAWNLLEPFFQFWGNSFSCSCYSGLYLPYLLQLFLQPLVLLCFPILLLLCAGIHTYVTIMVFCSWLVGHQVFVGPNSKSHRPCCSQPPFVVSPIGTWELLDHMHRCSCTLSQAFGCAS